MHCVRPSQSGRGAGAVRRGRKRDRPLEKRPCFLESPLFGEAIPQFHRELRHSRPVPKHLVQTLKHRFRASEIPLDQIDATDNPQRVRLLIEARAHRSGLLQLSQRLLQPALVFQTHAKLVAGRGEVFRFGIIANHRAQHLDCSLGVSDPPEISARLQQGAIRKIARGKKFSEIAEHLGGIRETSQFGQTLPPLHPGFGNTKIVRVTHDETLVSGQGLRHRAGEKVRPSREKLRLRRPLARRMVPHKLLELPGRRSVHPILIETLGEVELRFRPCRRGKRPGERQA